MLENKEQKDWHQIVITVKGALIKENTQRLEFLGAGQSVQVRTISIMPDIMQLSQITEAISTTFTITVSEESGQLLEQEMPITLMACDQWAGSGVMPEQIAAFVVPNNPALSRILINAARWLERLTGSSQLDEYQTQDRNRVRAQVAAIYEALRAEGIVYCAPPASFERSAVSIAPSEHTASTPFFCTTVIPSRRRVAENSSPSEIRYILSAPLHLKMSSSIPAGRCFKSAIA